MNIICQSILLSMVLLFAGCTPHKKISLPENVDHSFPADLLYKGQPIHPCKVLGSQFTGDFSHFEPISVVCRKDKYKHDIWHAYPYVNESRSEKKLPEWSGPYSKDDEYQYVGSYKDRHIILGFYYDTRGTGRFASLMLLKRDGDTIVNAGIIAGGDRGCGGGIDIISFENNILRYSQYATIDIILRVLINESIEIIFPSGVSGLSLMYEVNLDAPLECGEFPSQVIALLFDQCGYDFSDYPDCWAEGTLAHTRERIERFFYSVADEYVKKGKRELNLEEARVFAQEALQCIQKNMINDV